MSEIQTAPVSRRNAELWLLILALAVAIGAGYLAGLSNPAGLSPEFAKQGGILCVLAFGMHIVLRIWAKYADPIILPCVVALNGIGVAMIHRLDIIEGTDAATRQLLWTGVAIAAAIAVIWALRDHRILRRATFISLAVTGVLMVLPLIPGLGVEINGARIWVRLAGMSFQPGELAKITLAIFFAGYLSNNRDLILLAGHKIGPLQLPRLRDMAPMMIAWGLSIGILVLQRDLGSAILFFGLFMAMIYVATARISWILIGLALVAVAGVAAAQVMGHVAARINAWLNAFDPDVINADYGSYQIVQGMFGLANGGLFGTGFDGGRPDLIPYANSDMIVTALGEALGLIGVIAVVMLYVLLVSRGIRAALGTRDAFGKLLASGLSFTIGLQCFVVIGGITRLIPLTGLTTPFVAAGGSSLLSNWIIIALLLLVSNNARKPVPSAETGNEAVLTKGASA